MQVPDGYKGVYHEVGNFSPHVLNSDIWAIMTGLIVEQSRLQRTKMYISGLIPMGPSVLESSHACNLCYDLVFQGDLPAPFRACSPRVTVSETTRSNPQSVWPRTVPERNAIGTQWIVLERMSTSQHVHCDLCLLTAAPEPGDTLSGHQALK